jgi:catechol 2,3-dioxygenase-like lactoylglutathione lyase family enzyme
MINGAHVIIYSKDADADRELFKSVLQFPHVDVGHGWLIFKLPPSEIAVHPSDENDLHKLYLMCDDLAAEIARLKAAGVDCAPPNDRGWGIVTEITLPGGGKLGFYQPRHERP